MTEKLYRDITSRTELALGKDVCENLFAAKILIVGVGGVGSWCAEALVRSGVKRITLIDFDSVCATNINRQSQAHSGNVGKAKVDEMKKKLLLINPSASVEVFNMIFSEENHDEFDIESFDYIVDAIDFVKHKVFLLKLCVAKNKKIISSMGAGSRTDASKLRLSTLAKTQNCSLAKAVRCALRKENVTLNIPCVYSEEIPVSRFGSEKPSDNEEGRLTKKIINGSLMHITASFGLMIAGAIIRDAAGIEKINAWKR